MLQSPSTRKISAQCSNSIAKVRIQICTHQNHKCNIYLFVAWFFILIFTLASSLFNSLYLSILALCYCLFNSLFIISNCRGNFTRHNMHIDSHSFLPLFEKVLKSHRLPQEQRQVYHVFFFFISNHPHILGCE